MRTFGVPLLLALALALAGCGEVPRDADSIEQEIVNGRSVTSARPAVGYLAVRNEDGPTCTATLVEPNYVVTAAHCVRGIAASSLVFGTGAFRASGPTRVTVARCKSNPQYRNTDAGAPFDFAYCELAQPITAIKPLAFATTPAFGASYLAFGYGQTDAEDENSIGPRKQLVVHRVDPEGEPRLSGLEAMLAVSSAGGNTCYGDSGGPLLVIGSTGVARVAGVLSEDAAYSDEVDCGPGGISVYAPAAKNMDFFATRDD